VSGPKSAQTSAVKGETLTRLAAFRRSPQARVHLWIDETRAPAAGEPDLCNQALSYVRADLKGWNFTERIKTHGFPLLILFTLRPCPASTTRWWAAASFA
jgi:hypothetical protein